MNRSIDFEILLRSVEEEFDQKLLSELEARKVLTMSFQSIKEVFKSIFRTRTRDLI
jgi:hypothetical protein